MDTIKIAIADDEALFRKGMKLILQDYKDLDVTLEAENGIDLLDKLSLEDDYPDILLLDLKMPGMDGIEATKVIRDQYPDLKIIIISTHFSKAFIINMIELGASSYLPKNSEPQEVVETIHAVHSTGFHYNKAVMEYIHENIVSKTKSRFPFDLTPREKEILQLICEQYTTPEIGAKLFISPRTVDGHRNNLLSKLDCKNIAGLVVFALQNEVVNLTGNQFRL